jgi:hypothetical protein
MCQLAQKLLYYTHLTLIEALSQMAPYSLYSALLLIRAHRALVKSSALYREYGAIWHAAKVSDKVIKIHNILDGDFTAGRRLYDTCHLWHVGLWVSKPTVF